MFKRGTKVFAFPKISKLNFKKKIEFTPLEKIHKIQWTEPPQNIILLSKLNSSSEETILKVGEYLSKKYPGINLIIQDSPILKDIFKNLPNVYTFTPKDDISKVDLIIASGGDGTLLHINSLCQNVTQLPPILGFSKGGSFGFLMPHSADEYQNSIDTVMNNQSIATNRMRLFCDIQKHGCTDQNHIRVINEVVVHRGENQVPILLNIYVNGKQLTTVRGDGIIISTPTGSTGYSLSSGGAMCHPLIDCILITPICPRSLSFRPILLPSYVKVELKVPEGSISTAASFDGLRYIHLESKDCIVVQKCPSPLLTIDKTDSITDWIVDLNERLFFNIKL